MFTAPDAATELVELREAEALSLFDQDDTGIGHIDANFDYGGSDQDVVVFVFKITHHGVFFFGLETTMYQPYTEIREYDFGQVSVFSNSGLHIFESE